MTEHWNNSQVESSRVWAETAAPDIAVPESPASTADNAPFETRTAGTRLFRAILWLAAFGMGQVLGTQATVAEDRGLPADEIKAAFVVNFPKYVSWPAGAFARNDSPLIVTVFGNREQTDALRQMIVDKNINGHPLQFKLAASEEECARDSHILFIGNSNRHRIQAILERLKGSSVLTVGESDDFLDRGGVINLAQRDRKIRLEVNLQAAGQAHLQLSSKLLSVAIVKGKSN